MAFAPIQDLSTGAVLVAAYHFAHKYGWPVLKKAFSRTAQTMINSADTEQFMTKTDHEALCWARLETIEAKIGGVGERIERIEHHEENASTAVTNVWSTVNDMRKTINDNHSQVMGAILQHATKR